MFRTTTSAGPANAQDTLDLLDTQLNALNLLPPAATPHVQPADPIFNYPHARRNLVATFDTLIPAIQAHHAACAARDKAEAEAKVAAAQATRATTENTRTASEAFCDQQVASKRPRS